MLAHPRPGPGLVILLLPAGIFVVAALVLAGCVWLLWLAYRRREGRRTQCRYVYNDGDLVRIPPPLPHDYCTWMFCWNRDEGPCRR